MKKITQLCVCALLVCAATSTMADAKPSALTPEERAARKAARQEEFLKATGGRIKDVRQQKGSLVIVDAQQRANRAWAESVAAGLNESVKIDTKVKAGSLEGLPQPSNAASPTIYLVDNQTSPSILVAPEQFWAVVNVAPVFSEKTSFFEARVKKQIVRAFAMLCGAPMSGYENPLTSAVLKTEDLDEIIDWSLPADIRSRCQKYLAKCGVTPYKMSTYYDACEQGWAPAPTNDYQKAIWAEMRKIPEKPVKIKFDETKGR